MSKKFSSYKEQQMLFENWRNFTRVDESTEQRMLEEKISVLVENFKKGDISQGELEEGLSSLAREAKRAILNAAMAAVLGAGALASGGAAAQDISPQERVAITQAVEDVEQNVNDMVVDYKTSSTTSTEDGKTTFTKTIDDKVLDKFVGGPQKGKEVERNVKIVQVKAPEGEKETTYDKYLRITMPDGGESIIKIHQDPGDEQSSVTVSDTQADDEFPAGTGGRTVITRGAGESGETRVGQGTEVGSAVRESSNEKKI
jgi:hypothetical protein